ncbi:vacuolar membrane PQ loop repeat protein-like protein [Westerdykella ornata]|uniref:Vacuolar membrane PQ loop repeat protein-like protein n=1 Tax=Westerdykella ornata TaxID=318751 RepID=A0A6A6JV29_WESOR|nr:vacuolar membrane PQ loop repeat protein-like protein [Westerdykella ornata]KAF2279678.1 vacuolar membrane PQ loop repeat protein-like protein [Westerdykella ornata]
MAAPLLAVFGQTPPLATHEALSGVFGSISLAAWIFLLVPQVIENYKQHSADGISLAFLTVWFIGDITNLLGAIWAGLVPTVIALAVYFCFADLVLITQCLYYNWINARKASGRGGHRKRNSSAAVGAAGGHGGVAVDAEQQPLLARRDSSNLGLPGSHRRKSSTASRMRRRASSLPSIGEDVETSSEWVKNTLSIMGVCVVGAAGWAIAWRTGVWRPTPEAVPGGEDARDTPLGAEVLGYASALCYLGARIPQIIKNQRDRSCEGLSLLFFMLSLLGNATYGAGILFHSIEKEYFLTNLPWLIGSLGTIAEDITIFIQFRIFGDAEQTAAIQ